MYLLLYALVLFHGLFVLPIIFVVPFILAFSKKKLRFLENIFILIGGVTILSYILTGACFLTAIEQKIRFKIDPELSYSGGFVSYYLGSIGINFPDLATTFLIILMFIFGMVVIWNRRKKKKTTSPVCRNMMML